MTGAPVLTVRGLSVSLPGGADRALAIDDVDLTVARDRVLCVVGESGSGKSVTAQAVTGLLPPALRPTIGRIEFGGVDLLSLSPGELRVRRGREIGMIFQEPMTALNPLWRVGRQVEELYAVHRRAPRVTRRAQAEALLDDVNLDVARTYDAFPHQLSGGQRQRVMIAMALALEPKLLIADEPTTALDVTTQAQVLRLIRDLRRERGMAVMFITHDFGVVAEIADDVAVMRGGRVVESGTAETVLDRPSHDYTRRLIAAVPTGRRTAALRAGAPLLEVRGLQKVYSRRRMLRRARTVALAGVSFDLSAGEILGVVGESGSGKSTVARCVARLLDPDAGAIRLRGDDFGSLRGEALRRARRRCQIVFQDPYSSLNPRVRVGDAIAHGPMNYGASPAEARARAGELLAAVGLDPSAAARFPGAFSGGQRQRICLARALALEPDLLIADEAVSALDVSVQAEIIALLRDIRRERGIGVLFITHDLRVAAELCDRVVVMRGGEIVEAGPTAEVFGAPEHAYTRELLAAIPGRAWFDRRETVEPAPER